MKGIEALLAEHGIDGEVVRLEPNYVIVRQSGAKNKVHQMVAYCRHCYKQLAESRHTRWFHAIDALKSMIGKLHKCWHAVREVGQRIHRHGSGGKVGIYSSGSLGIGAC
jgi:hypothetical protein